MYPECLLNYFHKELAYKFDPLPNCDLTSKLLEARGPHCSPEKPVQIIISYHWLREKIPSTSFCENWIILHFRGFLNFLNVFSLFRNYLPLEQGVVLHLNKLESPLPMDALCQVWLRLAKWILRGRFLNCIDQCIFAISKLSPLEQGVALYLNKLESPLPKDALCRVWLKLAQWFLRRFPNFVNVFSLFHNHLPLEKGLAHYFKNLNPLYPRMLCAKFGWNWPSGSWEEDENVKSLQIGGQTAIRKLTQSS